MNFNELIIHDSIILSVTENTLNDNYIFLLDWCNESGDGPYIKAELVFEDVVKYEIHEIAFHGHPTILEITEIGVDDKNDILRKQYKIETNAGYRTLYCKNINLKSVNQKNAPEKAG